MNKPGNTIIVLAALILGACGGKGHHGCGDDLPAYTEFTVTDYSVLAVRHSTPVSHYSLAYEDPVGNAPVAWDHLGLELEAHTRSYQARAPAAQWSLFPTASACSPVPPQPTQAIESISVVSDNAYTDELPAGSELASVLAPYGDTWGETGDSLATYLADTPMAGNVIGLFFTEAPQYRRHTFTITIELDDGSRFVKDSPEIEFQIDSDTQT